ncbi:MAG: TraR/DksA family transcriptional regulator [Chitinophagaceae bacterium]|nr:TraR/DksA family transcriptional regulator [Chitinophagaceae bacterium]MCW5929724.1 TraR/DksA family transcriptional regulator [Chitinophagaceae bacterium]
MATNKKAAKKTAATKAAKPVKKAPKKAVKATKAAPKKAAVAKQPAKPKPAAKKPVAKPAAKKATTKKPEVKKPAKKATPVKKAAPVKKTAPAKKLPVKKVVKEEIKKPVVKEQKPVTPVLPVKPVVKAKEKPKAEPSKPVVIPKLSTSVSRKYEPEFTQSVLDKPSAQQNGPIMRYSDAELTEFRELIQRKLEAAKKELNYLQGLITRKDDMGGDESENRYMTMEDGSISMEREQLSQMASRQIQYIDHLEKAMMRIENKTYGICRVTGKLIDKARLRAVPHATLSIEAKMGFAKNPNIQ